MKVLKDYTNEVVLATYVTLSTQLGFYISQNRLLSLPH